MATVENKRVGRTRGIRDPASNGILARVDGIVARSIFTPQRRSLDRVLKSKQRSFGCKARGCHSGAGPIRHFDWILGCKGWRADHSRGAQEGFGSRYKGQRKAQNEPEIAAGRGRGRESKVVRKGKGARDGAREGTTFGEEVSACCVPRPNNFPSSSHHRRASSEEEQTGTRTLVACDRKRLGSEIAPH